MRIIALTSLSLLLFSCAGTASTDDKPSRGSNDSDATPGGAEIQIDNPTAGAEFDAGQAIALDLSATKDGRDLTPTQVTWTIGDWAGMGAHTEATGLAVGDYVVQVTATVDGETLDASASFSVLPTELNYNGTLTATATLTTDFGDFDADCAGPISYVVTRRSGALTGGGDVTCSSDFGDQAFAVELDGTASGGSVNGNLTLEGNDTPFAGTGDFGEDMSATFDGTFSNNDGSLRFQGGWSASPQ